MMSRSMLWFRLSGSSILAKNSLLSLTSSVYSTLIPVAFSKSGTVCLSMYSGQLEIRSVLPSAAGRGGGAGLGGAFLAAAGGEQAPAECERRRPRAPCV